MPMMEITTSSSTRVNPSILSTRFIIHPFLSGSFSDDSRLLPERLPSSGSAKAGLGRPRLVWPTAPVRKVNRQRAALCNGNSR